MPEDSDNLEYLRDFDPRHVSEVPPGTAFIYMIEGSVTDTDGGYIPSIVYENVSGHFPLTGKNGGSPYNWGDYDLAVRTARESNERMGIGPERELEIIISSRRQATAQGKFPEPGPTLAFPDAKYIVFTAIVGADTNEQAREVQERLLEALRLTEPEHLAVEVLPAGPWAPDIDTIRDTYEIPHNWAFVHVDLNEENEK